MKRLILIIAALSVISCGGRVNRPTPERVVYKDLIEDSETITVQRISYYSLDSTQLDTVRKVHNTLQIPKVVERFPEDRVDLNKIFGSPGDETDYNYTEIDEEDWEYLRSIGIVWDERKGYFVKRK